MHQRITFVATVDVDTEGLNWEMAAGLVGATVGEATLVRVIRLEHVEDE